LRSRKNSFKHANGYKITGKKEKKRKKTTVDNDKAQGTIIQSGKMTDDTNDPSKATNDKASKASVAASINSTTQSEPTIHTAVHVGART
jgi:hypothetical protein